MTRGSDKVFEDIGFEREEAASLKVRADLMLNLKKYIETRGWTQLKPPQAGYHRLHWEGRDDADRPSGAYL